MQPDEEDVVHTLVTGGARSGKSRFALDLALRELCGDASSPRALFIATASVRDDEMRQRVEAHKRERGRQWHTIEEEIELGSCLSKNIEDFDVAVIDCLGMWVTNILLTESKILETEAKNLEQALNQSSKPVILVSNEVGLGIVPENRLARQFRDMLGNINQKFARLCSRVILMVAGIPLVVKGPVP